MPFLIAQYGGELATAAADPDIGPDGISITAISRALPDPHAIEYDPAGGTEPDPADPGQTRPKTRPVVYDDSLGNMLLQGTISEDMAKQFATKAQAHRITFSYTLDSGSGDSDGSDGADYSDVGDERTATLDITATNAVTQAYRTLTSYDSGDTVPAGLAASYLGTLNQLQWAGTVVLEDSLPGATAAAGLGDVLNIAGSEQAAWAAMKALIVREEVQASTGRTTLTFGPAAHLSPTEMLARLRTVRPGGRGGRASLGALSTDRSSERSSGAPSDAHTIGGGSHFPTRVATPVPLGAGDAAPMPFDVVAPDDAGETGTVYGQVNTYSLFLPSEASTDTMDVTGLGEDVALSAGLLFYLQVDASNDGTKIDEVSVVHNTAGFDDKRITYGGSGTQADPYVWDQSFFPLAQVYACNGKATHGGTIFQSGDGKTSVEVVNLCSSHLGAIGVIVDGVVAMGVVKTAASF